MKIILGRTVHVSYVISPCALHCTNRIYFFANKPSDTTCIMIPEKLKHL